MWLVVGLWPVPHLYPHIPGDFVIAFLFLVCEGYYGYLSLKDVSQLLFLFRNLQKDTDQE